MGRSLDLIVGLLCAASIAGADPAKRPTPAKKPAKTAKKSATTKHKSRRTARIATKRKTAAKHEVVATTTTKTDAETDPNNPPTWLHPADPKSTPAYRYGELTADACFAELDKRKISVTREAATAGVLAPVRLQGALHGVVFHGDQDDKHRATSPYEIVDCRLVLALDDFAALLEKHGIVDVKHYSMYRPPPSPWPEGQLGTRHPGGLALDAAAFTTKDGTTMSVLDDFHGGIGTKTCGDGAAPAPATDKAKELRAILCEAADQHLFNVMLTPNYNPPHKNHFHLEVTAGKTWFLLH